MFFGRPHVDVVVMSKMLILQACLSDEQLKVQCKDRLTFQNFRISRKRSGCKDCLALQGQACTVWKRKGVLDLFRS
ncbi:MAG: hypothetical protein C0177_05225 [Fervidicoccus fontis]|nr:MAG: hypothetical protein C0177_05225 [Fervidicoccus fontis]